MAVNKPVNLLEVAKTLDPRFVKDMPQEVADAFARGDIQRLIRTSKDMPGITPDLRTPAQGGRAADQFGDYTGSIYAQHKDGRIARFKNPEVAAQGDDMRHAGWNARTAGIKGRSAFFDQAHVIREDSFAQVGSPERIAFDKAKALNPQLSGEQIAFALARQGHSIATPTTAPASDIMGKQIFETMKVGSTDADPKSTHKGDMVSDIFEATGERHYFAGTTSVDQKSARGSAQVEPIESYMARKGSVLPDESIQAAPVEKPKAVIETTKSGRPTIKVGTPTKTEEAPPKVEEEPKKKTTLKAGKPIDEVKTATPVKKISETTEETIKDVTEVITAGVDSEDKIYEKGEEKLDEKAEETREKLLEAVVEGEKKNSRMLSAAGKAPVDSPLKKKLVSGITEVTGKAPGKTTMELLDATEGLSRGVLTAMKDGKNLRLAGTAALLSVAGFAVGKKRDSVKKRADAPMDADRESELRRSLMSDG